MRIVPNLQIFKFKELLAEFGAERGHLVKAWSPEKIIFVDIFRVDTRFSFDVQV